MTQVHPLAVVEPGAELGARVVVGPFCHVGAGVQVGDDCVLHTRVTLLGPATFGPGNVFFPGCVLGAAPQDLKYKGGPTRLEVGARNTFREYVTVHRGTEVDRRSRGVTRIGNHNLLMVGVHVAHDAELGDHIILANQVQLAGHVCIEDCVNVGGLTAMHHFVTVGRYAYVAGMTRISHDVPPFMKVFGYDQAVRAVNSQGLARWKFPDESIQCLRGAWKLLYARRGEHSPGRTAEALREIEDSGMLADPHVRYLYEFLQRKLAIGIFGRVREYYRSDGQADRETFYAASDAERSS